MVAGPCRLHQLSSYSGCDTSESVSKEYLKWIPKASDRVVVVFGGYAPSTKDHEHKRRARDFCPDRAIKRSTLCTVSKEKLLPNNNNKKGLIDLHSDLFAANGLKFAEQETMLIQW